MSSTFRTPQCAFLAAALSVLCAADISRARIVINEIRTGQPGPDNQDYFELASDAGEAGDSLENLYYLVIGDDEFGGNSGVIEKAFSLSHGFARYYLAANGHIFQTPGGVPTNSVGGNFAYGFELEDDDNVTHLLVSHFCWPGICSPTGDLDTNDDGVLDYRPWSRILDSVSIVKDPTATVSEKYYSPNVVGPDGLTSPTHIYRSPNFSGGWVIGDYDGLPNGFRDTPGAANHIVPEPASSTVALLVINTLALAGRQRPRRGPRRVHGEGINPK
jgi:hypothetical protein